MIPSGYREKLEEPSRNSGRIDDDRKEKGGKARLRTTVMTQFQTSIESIDANKKECSKPCDFVFHRLSREPRCRFHRRQPRGHPGDCRGAIGQAGRESQGLSDRLSERAVERLGHQDFNPFIPAPDDFTHGGIYEPLMIITQAGGSQTYPWLATKYKWSQSQPDSDGSSASRREVVRREAIHVGRCGVHIQLHQAARHRSKLLLLVMYGHRSSQGQIRGRFQLQRREHHALQALLSNRTCFRSTSGRT